MFEKIAAPNDHEGGLESCVRPLGSSTFFCGDKTISAKASDHAAAAGDESSRLGERLRVLLIEDNRKDARVVRGILEESALHKCQIEHVWTLAEAMIALDGESYDVMLLDLTLPDAKGIEGVNRLIEFKPDIPIVVMSSSDDEQSAVEALKSGAQDYLVKSPTDTKVMIRSLRYAIERKRTEQHIHQLANYDRLTKLPNRDLCQDRLRQAIAQAARQNTLVALLFFDLDRFKVINETLGHAHGDQLLQHVAQRMKSSLRETDTVGRLGGDEFVVILTGLTDTSDAARVAQNILNTLVRPITLDDHEVFVTTSIGISLYPNDAKDVESLTQNADTAMYRAKEQGRNHYQFYTLDMNARALERLNLENDLRHALERDEFLLHYQPQLDLSSQQIVGFEALLRWDHTDLGFISPVDFIPIAEETGLIMPIGEWVLNAACQQAKQWQDQGFKNANIAVNLSNRQFAQENVLETVTKALDSAGLDPSHLELEITESCVMVNPEEAIVVLRQLNDMGVRISIDDFGTGYSSLSYLKRFPLDTLKIDRSFVNDITDDPDSAVIVEAILAMAHSLRLNVVAEGVETREQMAFLEAHDCDMIQGYLLSKPLPAKDAAERFLKNNGAAALTKPPAKARSQKS